MVTSLPPPHYPLRRSSLLAGDPLASPPSFSLPFLQKVTKENKSPPRINRVQARSYINPLPPRPTPSDVRALLAGDLVAPQLPITVASRAHSVYRHLRSPSCPFVKSHE